MKVDHHKTIDIGIDYGNRYCEGKLTFENIADFSTIRKILLTVYAAMISLYQMIPIEKITDEEKLELKKISAKYANKLNEKDRIDYCKAIWVLAEIVDRFCLKRYFPNGIK